MITCQSCFYYDKCPSREICEEYTPITEEGEAYLEELLMEQERREFDDEWEEYLSDN